jgi:hypothetical protein
MAFSCLPTTIDPRVKLLKQATITGMPARNRESIARTQSTMSRSPPRFSLSTGTDDRSNSNSKSPFVPPAPTLREDSIEELLKAPLSVDIATVFDEDEDEDETPSMYTRPNDPEGLGGDGGGRPAAQSVGAFSRRAFVAEGSYRVGWLIDSERNDCVRCRRRFGSLIRRHHCRACGIVFCLK